MWYDPGMGIEPYRCKIHGDTTAYVYKNGPRETKRRTCRECRRLDVSREWWRVKLAVIEAYGGRCECCGESGPEFLTIDHINGDGNEHRKAGLRGWRLYQWLAKRGYPKDAFRLLCLNCNFARGQFGECPHKRA